MSKNVRHCSSNIWWKSLNADDV